MDEISSVMSNLSISIQTQNFYDFASKLSAFNDSLNLLIDSNGNSLFHLITWHLLKESECLKFWNKLVEEYEMRYGNENENLIKAMVDSQNDTDSYTPLMNAVKNNLRVNFI